MLRSRDPVVGDVPGGSRVRKGLGGDLGRGGGRWFTSQPLREAKIQFKCCG